MKPIIILAVLILTLASSLAAYAQGGQSNEETAADKANKAATEKAYNSALSVIPQKETTNDPWRGMRENAPTEKPPAPKKKPR